MGAKYDGFRKAKAYLRGHPEATDEELAGVSGLKLAFAEERDVLKAARADFEADRASAGPPRSLGGGYPGLLPGS